MEEGMDVRQVGGATSKAVGREDEKKGTGRRGV